MLKVPIGERLPDFTEGFGFKGIVPKKVKRHAFVEEKMELSQKTMEAIDRWYLNAIKKLH